MAAEAWETVMDQDRVAGAATGPCFGCSRPSGASTSPRPAAGSGGARRKIEGWRRESHGGERGQPILDCFHAGAVTTLSVAA
jgi:hypothetical protein